MTDIGSDSKTNESNEKNDQNPIPEERLEETKHSITLNGKKIDYTARVGTMIIHKEEDEKAPKAKAEVFFIYYSKDDEDVAKRPVTFSFNGGPGSSSVWLHLGVLGPRRVVSEIDEKPVAPPYQLIDNEYSLLETTDLIFIDPISTGWSRPVPGEKAEQFHGYEKDLESVGEFIRMFISRYQRWSSPKFLIGESYGTVRASGLSGLLQMKHGMYLNGIMLVSCVLNFQTWNNVPGNDLAFIMFLPTYTASAWYHKKLPADLQAKSLEEVLDEAREFAATEYNQALMLGSRLLLDEVKYNDIVAKIARYSGLTETYIKQTNLKINIFKFCKELRKDERLTVGRLDTRFVGRDRDAAGMTAEFDPSYATIQGVYTATFNDYVSRELNFKSDLPYNILVNLFTTWKYDKQQNQYLNVGETLRQAMSYNPFMKVIVANGYYDLATPFFATEYTMDHLELESELHKNIKMTYYKAGHMMYSREEDLAKLSRDLTEFVKDALEK